MAKSLVFVSCGQLTDAEKTVGTLLKTVIDGTPDFEAYFAETVQDLEALGIHIFGALQRCVGAVVVMHDRGVVLQSDGIEWGHRSSVWVNQELAILAYRQFSEGTRIPILAFADPRVKLEGAMTNLIVNARPLSPLQDLEASVRHWLATASFGGGSEHAFASKWSRLSENSRKVVAVLLDEGGQQVKEIVVRRGLTPRFGMQSDTATRALREAKLQFMDTDLVKLIPNSHSGDELSVHPTWQIQLRQQIRHWLGQQGRQ